MKKGEYMLIRFTSDQRKQKMSAIARQKWAKMSKKDRLAYGQKLTEARKANRVKRELKNSIIK